MLLRHYSRRFACHPQFMFLAFDVLSRQQSSIGSKIVAKRKDWARKVAAIQKLSKEDLSNAAEDLKKGKKPHSLEVFSLLESIRCIGQRVDLSSDRR